MIEKQVENEKVNAKADQNDTRQTIYPFPRPLFAK